MRWQGSSQPFGAWIGQGSASKLEKRRRWEVLNQRGLENRYFFFFFFFCARRKGLGGSNPPSSAIYPVLTGFEGGSASWHTRLVIYRK